MKNFLFLLAFVLLAGYAQAQDGERALRKAGSALSAYNIDPSNNLSKLHEAVQEIKLAMDDPTIAATVKAWQTQGDIYYEISNQIVNIKQLNFGKIEDLPKVDNPGLVAYEAYMRALQLAVKKFESKAALTGLRQLQSNLYNLGIMAYENGDYASAFSDFEAVLNAHKTLKDNGEESSLDETNVYNDQLYITGLAALNAQELPKAKPYFLKLYELKTDKPAVYEALYTITAAENIDEAYTYLDAGRKLYPDDVSLLFAEINHFLRINKLEELISKLEAAIAKEPKNVSLYSTLGSVYDNLHQREAQAGNKAQADAFLNSALDYYQRALAIDPNFFDAIYSIGAVYFNRAASLINEQKNLGLSAAEQKRYDALQTEITAEFEKALPYFKKCEGMNPNDLNTLIALKEIYVRINDPVTSNVFKSRLEKVQAGGTNEAPYFKN
jgi:tetratricopeptide (TPR) repeat protein